MGREKLERLERAPVSSRQFPHSSLLPSVFPPFFLFLLSTFFPLFPIFPLLMVRKVWLAWKAARMSQWRRNDWKGQEQRVYSMDGTLERLYTWNQCDRSVIPKLEKKIRRGMRGKLRDQLSESQLVRAFALGPPLSSMKYHLRLLWLETLACHCFHWWHTAYPPVNHWNATLLTIEQSFSGPNEDVSPNGWECCFVSIPSRHRECQGPLHREGGALLCG